MRLGAERARGVVARLEARGVERLPVYLQVRLPAARRLRHRAREADPESAGPGQCEASLPVSKGPEAHPPKSRKRRGMSGREFMVWQTSRPSRWRRHHRAPTGSGTPTRCRGCSAPISPSFPHVTMPTTPACWDALACRESPGLSNAFLTAETIPRALPAASALIPTATNGCRRGYRTGR